MNAKGFFFFPIEIKTKKQSSYRETCTPDGAYNTSVIITSDIFGATTQYVFNNSLCTPNMMAESHTALCEYNRIDNWMLSIPMLLLDFSSK